MCGVFLVGYNRSGRDFFFMHILCVLFIGTGLIEAIKGVSQLYGLYASNHYLFKLTGSFLNPGPFAGYLAMIFPMAFHGALTLPGSWTVLKDLGLCPLICTPLQLFRHTHRFRVVLPFLLFFVSVISVGCILVVLPATMSRSAWMGALTGSVYVVSFRHHWPERMHKLYVNHRKLFFTGLTVLLLMGTVFIAGMYLLKKPSADGRLLVWKITTYVIAEHPVFGVGHGHFSGAFGEAQANYFASGKGSDAEAWVAGVPEYAFNEYLQICAEWGLLGLLLFLLMVGVPFLSNKTASLTFSLQVGAKGSLLSLLVFACFSYPLSLLPFCIALVFLLALVASGYPVQTSGAQAEPPGKARFAPRWMRYAFFCLLTILALWLLRTHLPVWKADWEWHEQRVFYPGIGLRVEDMKTYQKLYPLLSNKAEFLFDYGKALTETGELRAANEIFLRALSFRGDPMFCNLLGKNYQTLRQYDLSEYWLTKASHMGPNLLYPHYLLAKMYRVSGQNEKALAKARYVIGKKPKVVSTATNEMKEEMQQLIKEIQNPKP